DRLEVEQVLCRRQTEAQRPGRILDELLGHVITALEGLRIDAGGEALTTVLAHDVKQARLVATRGEHPCTPFHSCPPGIGLDAAAASAGAAPTSGLHHHVTDLASRPPPIVEHAVDDEAHADAGSNPDPEEVLEGSTDSPAGV